MATPYTEATEDAAFAQDQPGHCVSRLPIQAGQDMGVDVHGHRDGPVAQPLADHLGRYPGGQRGTCMVMPQIMQPDLRI